MSSSSKLTQENTKKAISSMKEQLVLQSFEDKVYYYSFTEKKNQSGLMHNERILLFDLTDFGYFNKLPDNVVIPFPTEASIPKPKASYNIDKINTIQVKDNILEVKFKPKDGKKDQEQWILKMNSKGMAESWYVAIKNANKEKERLLQAKQQQKKQESSLLMQSAIKPQAPPAPSLVQTQPTSPSILPPLKVQQPPPNRTSQVGNNQPNTQPPANDLSSSTVIRKPDPIQNPPRPPSVISPPPPAPSPAPQNRLSSQIRKNKQQQLKKRESQVKKTLADDWNYKLLNNPNVVNTLLQFRYSAQSTVREIIDQICLPLSKRKNKNIVTDKEGFLEILTDQGMSVCLCLTLLSEKSKDPVYEEPARKQFNNLFRNNSYVFEVTKNSGRLRVPIMCMVEYKGFVALVKVQVTSDAEQAIDLNKQLDQVSHLSRIDKNIFVQEKNAKIVSPLQPMLYISKTDSVVFVEDLYIFLPEDRFTKKQEVPYAQLRKELVTSSQFQTGRFISHNRPLLKVRPAEDEVVQESINNFITKSIKELVKEWQNMDLIISSPAELQKLLHTRGLNMRHIGQVYKQCTIPMTKRICASDMICRALKVILRNQLQSELLAQRRTYGSGQLVSESTVAVTRVTEKLFDIVCNMFNTLLSHTKESDLLWMVVNKQTQLNFGTKVNRDSINEYYFVQCIFSQCGLVPNWDMVDPRILLQKKNYFQRSLFKQFGVKSKSYEFGFDKRFLDIEQLLANQKENGFEKIVSYLSLKTQVVPQFFHNDLRQRVILYLSGYVDPASKRQAQYAHLKIYEWSREVPLTVHKFRVRINELKWAMRASQTIKVLNFKEELVRDINRWCGEYHPFLGELYDLFSAYHSTLEQNDDALTMAKSSLINCIKLVGTSSLKTAECYYEIGVIYQKMERLEEAISHYKKSRSIIEAQKDTDSVAYGTVSLKVAKLSLYFGKITECIDAALKAIEVLRETEYEADLVQCYSLLARCYQVTDRLNTYQQLASFCSQHLNDLTDPLNYQALLKISIYMTVIQAPKKLKYRLTELLTNLPKHFTEETYKDSYNFLRARHDLPHRFGSMMQKGEELIDQMSRSQVLANWRDLNSVDMGNQASQFLGILLALLYFLGESYILGSLMTQ